MNPNTPEPAPKGRGREITPLVIRDLVFRSKMGAEKYGETLRAFNGRNALVDAYQEALDLAQYLRQAIEEQQQNEAEQREADRLYDEEIRSMSEGLDVIELDITPVVTSSPAPELQTEGLYSRPGRHISVSGPVKQCESILQEAQRLVHGDRGQAYGHPLDDMTRTAGMATALFHHKLQNGVRFVAEDISKFMVLVKLSREMNRPKRDNRSDGAGYFETLDMQIEERERRVQAGEAQWKLKPGEERATE